MKTAILAGGQGTRFREETNLRPKPMIDVGGKPILWHIMKHYAVFNMTDFVIALGYKGDMIKQYFLDYGLLQGNLKIDLRTGAIETHNADRVDWTVELIDTGEWTNTGGRIKRLAPYLKDETFMLTWGDGVSDIDILDLLAFHRRHGKLATVTTVRPPARFGYMQFDDGGDKVTHFAEKPDNAEGWINAAFFVLEPRVFDYIDDDKTQWEKEPMQRLAADGQLMAYRHNSFWQCMDTQRDKQYLEKLWESGNAPWIVNPSAYRAAGE